MTDMERTDGERAMASFSRRGARNAKVGFIALIAFTGFLGAGEAGNFFMMTVFMVIGALAIWSLADD